MTTSFPAKILLLLIKIYRWTFSPIIGNNCRFYPSCSHYAEEALQKHGALKGSGLAASRILKCHPFNSGGFDPVPK